MNLREIIFYSIAPACCWLVLLNATTHYVATRLHRVTEVWSHYFNFAQAYTKFAEQNNNNLSIPPAIRVRTPAEYDFETQQIVQYMIYKLVFVTCVVIVLQVSLLLFCLYNEEHINYTSQLIEVQYIHEGDDDEQLRYFISVPQDPHEPNNEAIHFFDNVFGEFHVDEINIDEINVSEEEEVEEGEEGEEGEGEGGGGGGEEGEEEEEEIFL
ncbi:Hypothetical protein CINCED_3A001634 [Cinara cedri]|uniref:Uncharacterized protein n=1 Tax=Cinara cedri TaxID=506608 RepID=A0A5E4NPM0_9HEMI|nr:Hypothetical protein CINCED_3A001634 [Cinara cedri]